MTRSTIKYLYLKIIATLTFTILNWERHGVAANRNMFSEGQEQFTGTDVTTEMFGKDNEDIFPVAYFDVNGDKLTDIIAVSRERNSINIFLAMDQAPHLRRAITNHSIDITKGHGDKSIVSVRPGDFTGNGRADLMVTLGKDEFTREDVDNWTSMAVDIVFCSIQFGRQKYEITNLKCESDGAIKMLVQEPMVLDLNGDMVLDLVGEQWVQKLNESMYRKQRMVWFSNNTKDSFQWRKEGFRVIGPYHNETRRDMTNVSANAFADIDGDDIPELILLTEDPITPKSGEIGDYYLETYEIVQRSNGEIAFQFKKPPERVDTSPRNRTNIIGQPMMVDFEHNGKLEHMFPYCLNKKCSKEIGIFVIDQGKALPLPLGPLMYEGVRWGFISPKKHSTSAHNDTVAFSMEDFYSSALSLRVGDYNLDGFPDLLGVLKNDTDPIKTRAVLFENIPCIPQVPENPCHYNRTFNANFEIFKDFKDVISASFYDIGDNGALDVLLVTLSKEEKAGQNQRFEIKAFENEMSFDASFLKVMVVTGQECPQCAGGIPYGNVLPGATVKYVTHNTKGVEESGVVVQTYRTAHMPLDLPCNVFGIGHSPNFIETLTVAISPSVNETYRREWLQIIPNSQIVVVPRPLEKPHRWTMKLFLTPSDVVLKTFGILVGICLVLATLAAGLEFKERREDRKARQNEAHNLVLWLR